LSIASPVTGPGVQYVVTAVGILVVSMPMKLVFYRAVVFSRVIAEAHDARSD
jgi:hypothetical protein